MDKIRCKLVCHSTSSHLNQIYTGFKILSQCGLVHLSQEITSLRKSYYYSHALLKVIINDNLRVAYDTYDGDEIDMDLLGDVDLYFKRSYSRVRIPVHLSDKVFPLGLNYDIYPDDKDYFAFKRHLFLSKGKKRVVGVLRSLKLLWDFTPRLTVMQSLPDFKTPARVLFMARAWDPYNNPKRKPEKIEERIRINEMRADCIRFLRREFGALFFGGFSKTEYSVQYFKELLLPDILSSYKENYLERLLEYPICVTTAGLQGSIGWKFGEYIAFSKAIVSEKLTCEAPGCLKAGENYLEFNNPEECLSQVSRLLSDNDLRTRIMINNFYYYMSFLRPDALVLNTLVTILAKLQQKDNKNIVL